MTYDRRTFLKASGVLFCGVAMPIPMAVASDTALVGSVSSNKMLSSIAADAIKNMASPGIQIAVWREGRSIAIDAQGSANLETSTPVSIDTIFRIGSLTKQFTATLIAMLQEQGRLSVHDHVHKYLPFFPNRDSPTLLELIHHTAGVHDNEESFIQPGPVSQIDIAKSIAKQSKLYDFPPGTAWLYSNANYILLGAVIEAVAKRALSQVALSFIFNPLRLDDTRFDECADVVKNRASGYSAPPSGTTSYVNAAYIPIEQAGGAGAVRSTCRDLCSWHQSLFSEKIVSAEMLKVMITPATLRDGRPITEGRFNPKDNVMGQTSYGYGMLLDHSTKGGGLIAMHSGVINGFSAYLATYVPKKHTVACICNADPGPHTPFSQLRRTVFSHVL